MNPRIALGAFLVTAALGIAGAACSPAPVQSDPYSMQALAEGQLRATQQAAIERAAAATLQAAELQERARAEIDVLNAYLGATQTAFAIDGLRATSTMSAILATDTAVANQSTATAVAHQARATQAALEMQMRQAARDEKWNTTMAWFYAIFWPVVIVLVLSGLGVLVWRGFNWLIEWSDRKRAIYQTPFGIITFEPDEFGRYRPRMLISNDSNFFRSRPNMNSLESGVQSITMSGSVLSSPPRTPDNSTASLALSLVQDAARVAGPASSVLPGWRQLEPHGWNSEKWQRVVAALRAAGLVETEQGRGTYLVRYACLSDLEVALRSRKVSIRPAPYPTAADAA